MPNKGYQFNFANIKLFKSSLWFAIVNYSRIQQNVKKIKVSAISIKGFEEWKLENAFKVVVMETWRLLHAREAPALKLATAGSYLKDNLQN